MGRRAKRPRRSGRPLVALLCAVLAAGCASSAATTPPGSGPAGSGPVPGSSGSTGSQAPAGSGAPGDSFEPLPPPGAALDPTPAADAVLAAPDDAAREAAILGVLDGVNIGVHTPDGDTVLVGGERTDGDFWVYDFQVRALAAGVRDGDAIELADLAADVATIAAENGGGSLGADDVAGAVVEAARSVAANPGQPRAYALAVALELGRRGRFGTDLAAPADGAPIVLDALSAFLVTFDLVAPALEAQSPAGASLDRRVASIGTAAAGPPCLRSGLGGANGWIAGVAAGSLASLTGVTNASFDRYLQGQLTGGTVQAKLEGPADWHHRHEDESGTVDGDLQEYVFQLRVRVTLSTRPVACGRLAGAIVTPSEGEIVGADVRWERPRLDQHGAVTEIRTTNTLGSAELSVDPSTERFPAGVGPERQERLRITAETNVLRALGGDLYSRLGGVPAIQRRSVNVDVKWHRSYAIELEVTSLLNITKGNTYTGDLGATTADGKIPVVEYRNHDQVPLFHGGQVVNPGVLTTSAAAGAAKGKCNAEWIDAKAGASREIDWQVIDLVVWPLDKIAMQMDVGAGAYETPDIYDGLVCTPSGSFRLGPSPGNVWESMYFLGHPRGLKYTGHGTNAWTILDQDAFERGGDLAQWHSDETCGGRCNGFMDIVLRVRPLPGP